MENKTCYEIAAFMAIIIVGGLAIVGVIELMQPTFEPKYEYTNHVALNLLIDNLNDTQREIENAEYSSHQFAVFGIYMIVWVLILNLPLRNEGEKEQPENIQEGK